MAGDVMLSAHQHMTSWRTCQLQFVLLVQLQRAVLGLHNPQSKSDITRELMNQTLDLQLPVNRASATVYQITKQSDARGYNRNEREGNWLLGMGRQRRVEKEN